MTAQAQTSETVVIIIVCPARNGKRGMKLRVLFCGYKSGADPVESRALFEIQSNVFHQARLG